MDEDTPLLRTRSECEVDRLKYGIGFDPDGDPDDPKQCSRGYKWGIVALLAAMAFTVTFTCISIIPIAPHVIKELSGKDQKSASVLLVTIWELGEAVCMKRSLYNRI